MTQIRRDYCPFLFNKSVRSAPIRRLGCLHFTQMIEQRGAGFDAVDETIHF
jgi:hypothetical protein